MTREELLTLTIEPINKKIEKEKMSEKEEKEVKDLLKDFM